MVWVAKCINGDEVIFDTRPYESDGYWLHPME